MLQRDIIAQILPVMTVFLGIVGAAVGSFLNVVVWRLPRGESLSYPGSHCPKCDQAIRPWENIPILSWVLLRGRCSNCGLPISLRYPLVETANAVLFLAVGWRVWNSTMPLMALWGYLFLAGCLLAASLIDIEHFLIPDKITFSGMVVAVLLAGVFPVTRIGSGIMGLPGGDQVITGGLLSWSPRLAFVVAAQPRVAAILDALVGIAVGYAMLWALLQAGRRLWGRARVRLDEPVEAVLTAAGLRIDAVELDWTWDDLLIRRSDRFEAGIVEIKGMEGVDVPDQGAMRLVVTDGSLRLGGTDRTA